MRYLTLLLVFAVCSCSQKIYVVRHAEKAVPDNKSEVMFDARNPPLSEAGEKRAESLRKELAGKKITRIFSTKYLRTLQTAEPLARARNIEVTLYDAGEDMPDLMQSIDSIKSGNILIVGHSNTVDDVVSKLTGTKQFDNLSDNEYDNLFIIKKSRKGVISFERKKYGVRNGE